MAKGYKHGGGGDSLNYKVVGGTAAPADPRENTIWVNTNVPIPAWRFAPEDYVDGEDIYASGTVKADHYLHKDGAYEEANANYNILTVDIPQNTGYLSITASSYSTTSVCHGFYDANDVLISTALRTPGTVQYPVPEGARKARISFCKNTSVGADVFAVLAGSYASEGTVWIITGKSSPVAFSATKKNPVMVYPISARQYVGGAWVDVTTMSYQKGRWVPWMTYFYRAGDECTGITGGWKRLYYNSQYGDITVSKNADNMTFSKPASCSVVYGTANKIDFTGKTKLHMECVRSGSGGLHFDLYENPSTGPTVANYIITNTTRQVITLDVSNVNVPCYVTIYFCSPNNTAGLTIYNVWAE